MRSSYVAGLIIIFSSLGASRLVAATPPQSQTTSAPVANLTTAQRDTAALVRLQAAIASHGGIVDSTVEYELKGQVHLEARPTENLPVVIRGIGSRQVRVETTYQDQTSIWIVNNGTGVIATDGVKFQRLLSNNVLFYRAHQLPSAILGDAINDPATGVVLSSKDGNELELLPMGTQSNSLPENIKNKLRQRIALNAITGLAESLFLVQAPENAISREISVEIRYSDYRPVQGFMVPFTQETYWNGKLHATLTLSNADMHASIAPSEFDIPQEVK